MKDYLKALNEAINAGTLPDFYLLEAQILEEKEDYAIKATQYIKSLLKRIFVLDAIQTNLRLVQKPINFDAMEILISGESSPNAYVISRNLNKPFMVITKGLLEAAKTEDEIIAVLAHELTHIIIAGISDSNRNNKLTESLCDAASIGVLDQMHCKKDAMSTMLKTLDFGTDIFSQIFDPHPSTDLRIKNLSVELGVYDLKQSSISTEAKEVPLPDFIEEGRNHSFPYYMEEELKAINYYLEPPSVQILLLAPYLRSLAEVFYEKNESIFLNKLDFFKLKLRQLNFNKKDKEQNDALGIAIDSVLNIKTKDAAIIRLVDFIYEAVGLEKAITPVGTIALFQTTINDFVEAKTIEVAEKKANQINQMSEQIRGMLSDIKYSLNGFTLPIGKTDMDIPWEKHLQWSSHNNTIRVTLAILNVLTYVKKNYPPSELQSLGYTINDELLKSGLSSFWLHDYKAVRRGKKLLLTQRFYEEKEVGTYAAEKKRLERLDDQASQLQINWEDLENNLPKFIEDNEEHLVWQETIYDKGYAFFQRIMEHLKLLEIMTPNDRYKAELIMRILCSEMNLSDYKAHSQPLKSAYWMEHWFEPGISLNHPFIAYILKSGKPDLIDLIPFRRCFLYVNSRIYFNLDYNEVPPTHSIALWDNKVAESKMEQANEDISVPIERRWLLTNYRELFGCKVVPVGNPLEAKKILMENLPNLHTLFWIFEIYQFTKNHKPESFNAIEIDYLSTRDEKYNQSELYYNYRKYLVPFQEQYFLSLLNADNATPHLLSDLIQCLSIFPGKVKFFEKYANVSLFEDKIFALYQVSSPQDKAQALKSLLYFDKLVSQSPKHEVETQVKFINPKIKNFYVDEYAKQLANQYGLDSGNQDYELQLKTHITEIVERMPLFLAKSVLEKLVDLIQAQKDLSYFARDTLKKVGLKEGTTLKATVLSAVAEAILKAVTQSQSAQLAFDTVQFLLAQDTRDDKKYHKVLLDEADQFLNIDDVSSAVLKDDPDRLMERLVAMRDLFKDLNYEQKILVIDQVIFPAKGNISIDGAKKYVLDKLFGSRIPILSFFSKPSGFQNNAEIRQIVESYLEAIESIAKTSSHKESLSAREKLILSAMLVSHAQSNTSSTNTLSRGIALKEVLESMGPAGRKMAQAIESHPQTPEDIKSELLSSKTNASPPLRWEVHDMAEHYPSLIMRMGKMLGAGSYGVTMSIEKINGAESAVTFLRPDAITAADQFLILEKMAEILIKKNVIFKPLNDMQREASASSRKEIDMQIAFHQQGKAQQMYDGLEITIDQHLFKFGVAEWIGFGERYKETKVISGEHFNDLAAGQYKHAAALAILAAELFNLLKGGHIDNDRHGGQQKISQINANESYIGNFDFGGVTLNPQKPWQKELLGSILGQALMAVAHPLFPKPLDAKLLANVAQQAQKKFVGMKVVLADGKEQVLTELQVQRYTGRLKRGLLALGNYISAINATTEDFKTIIQAIFATQQIDPVLQTALRKELGIYEPALNQFLETKQESIQIRKKM